MPTRRQVLTQFAAGAAASLRTARAARLPNVVLVLTGDQGYGDLRQPVEANFPIEATGARLSIQNVDQSKPVPKGAAGVTSQVELAAGKTKLQTFFTGAKGARGAHYVYVRRR